MVQMKNKISSQNKNEKIRLNINDRPINPEKIQNIDEIAVGPKCSNFLELLEKNLGNDIYIPNFK